MLRVLRVFGEMVAGGKGACVNSASPSCRGRSHPLWGG